MACSIRVRQVVAAQHFQRTEQRRRGLASAHGDADGLEHLARFDARLSAAARSAALQAVVRELGRSAASSQAFFEHAQRQRRIAFLRESARRRRRREFVGEEEIAHGEHVVQQPDALLNQRRDLRIFADR
jgi:hypothetical protein